jgi:aerobic carbon-monoxide dehydrogenase large subunit
MADGGVYRAVFLRMHPTGKAVLSLSEASQGDEAALAEVAAAQLGVPAEDIKVVHEDSDRFGEGNSFNSRPSKETAANVVATARKLRDKAQLIAGWMLEASPESLQWEDGRWSVGGDRDRGVRIQEVALRAFGADTLPEGVEGSLDAQTTYKVEEAQPAG